MKPLPVGLYPRHILPLGDAGFSLFDIAFFMVHHDFVLTDMKGLHMARERFLRFSLFSFIGVAALSILTVGVAFISAVMLIPSGFVERAFTEFIATFSQPFSFIMVVLTLGVALHLKPKIESFIQRILARRIDRYVIHAA